MGSEPSPNWTQPLNTGSVSNLDPMGWSMWGQDLTDPNTVMINLTQTWIVMTIITTVAVVIVVAAALIFMCCIWFWVHVRVLGLWPGPNWIPEIIIYSPYPQAQLMITRQNPQKISCSKCNMTWPCNLVIVTMSTSQRCNRPTRINQGDIWSSFKLSYIKHFTSNHPPMHPSGWSGPHNIES